MENKRNVILIIAVIVVILVLALVLAKNKKGDDVKEVDLQEEVQQENKEYVKALEDGTQINTSKEFNSTKTYNGLEISNIQFTEEGGMTVLLAEVKNTNSTKHEIEVVKITILGASGEVITEIEPVIGEIEAGGKIQLNAAITADVVNAKDFKIEAKN